MSELAALSPTLAAPEASTQAQYIGTCVDNTLVLLTSVANSIDRGSRSISFSEEHNWHSAMKAVHRSFYASIITCAEKACSDLCEEKGLEVESGRARTSKKLCAMLESAGIEDVDLLRRIQKQIVSFAGSKPNFADYINTVIKSSSMVSGRAKMWKKYFAALHTVRNKASHSNPALSENEVKLLKASGFVALVSPANELQLNPKNYKQICEHALLFFKEVMS